VTDVGNVAVAFVMFSSNDCMVRPSQYSEEDGKAESGAILSSTNANDV